MSGGVDSSVVAHMLTRQGHEVVGVRFTLWTDPLAPALAQILPNKCCTTQNIQRAASVAKQLDIPLHVLDLADAFKEEVVDPFLQAHRDGRTPNPCIGCNRSLKFGRLLALADELGCERLATGHYARVARERLHDGEEHLLLLEAIDAAKDQSYFLYGLSQEQLARSLFPLGGMHKADVYALAREFAVPIDDASYRESQDLCFFPEKSPTAFLQRHLQDALVPGPVVRSDGTIVGTHQGLPLYTVGQRRLGIGGNRIPLEVVGKDVASNTLIVADRGSVHVEDIVVRDLRWVSWRPDDQTETVFDCRIRSLGERLPGTMRLHGNEGTFRFATPQAPVAPGQALVLYRGEEIVGGGEVTDA